MKIERAIEILDPEHREQYESLKPVNEACRMGMEALRTGTSTCWPAPAAEAASTCTTRMGTSSGSAASADRPSTGVVPAVSHRRPVPAKPKADERRNFCGKI